MALVLAVIHDMQESCDPKHIFHRFFVIDGFCLLDDDVQYDGLGKGRIYLAGNSPWW